MTEETSGIDLVREQFRIADGERLRITEDPAPRGHAIEFRINGEDPGRGFLPAPGTVTELRLPAGPGVRVDAGIESGAVIGGNFDSLLAKVIVVGRDPEQALERSRRALDEMVVDGMATALPFHRADRARSVLYGRTVPGAHPLDRDRVGQHRAAVRRTPAAPDADAEPRTTVVVEVGGKRLEVSLPAGSGVRPAAGPAARAGPRRSGRAQGRRRPRVGRLADQPDAGHHRQGRGGRRGHRGRGRPGRGPRGDEDGAAPQRSQGRRDHRAHRRGRRRGLRRRRHLRHHVAAVPGRPGASGVEQAAGVEHVPDCR